MSRVKPPFRHGARPTVQCGESYGDALIDYFLARNNGKKVTVMECWPDREYDGGWEIIAKDDEGRYAAVAVDWLNGENAK